MVVRPNRDGLTMFKEKWDIDFEGLMDPEGITVERIDETIEDCKKRLREGFREQELTEPRSAYETACSCFYRDTASFLAHAIEIRKYLALH